MWGIRPIQLTLWLVLVAALAGGWIWSYRRGSPDAYMDALRASMIDRNRDVLFSDHPLMLELIAKEKRVAVQAIRELKREVDAKIQEGLQRQPPFHWLRLGAGAESTWFIVSSRGTVGVLRAIARPSSQASGKALAHAPGYWEVDEDTLIFGRPPLPFGLDRSPGNMSMNGWQLSHTSFAVPYWVLCIVALIAPAWWLVSAMRRRNLVRSDRCSNCGYDLRASLGRCPECGTAREPSGAPVVHSFRRTHR